MKVAVFTLGCKVNQYDSDAIAARLFEKGFLVTQKLEPADVYIINTCAVTREAEAKSRQSVARVLKLNPNAKIFVLGCAGENDAKQFVSHKQVVNISGTHNKLAVCALVEEFNDKKSYADGGKINLFEPSKTFEDLGKSKSPRTRSYVKVQDGCDNYCSYCIIPYVRGRSRSRSVESIIDEIKHAEQSTKEIVLTGINLSAYGKDIKSSLANLLNSVAFTDARIRFGSLEAGVVDGEFLDATKKLKKFCPHFHLSLQSGDDGVLSSMNRKYSTGEYQSKVALIREYYPNAAITTDVIVGFPTETEEAFSNTLEFVQKIAFSNLHIFSYSQRKGTAAQKLKPLDSATVYERHKKLEAVKEQLQKNYNQKFIGAPLEVLFETKKNGLYQGHSENYITVYSENAARGELKIVVPSELFRDGLKG